MDIMRDQDRRIIRVAVVALAVTAAVIAPIVASLFLPGCVRERDPAGVESPHSP